MLLVIFAILSLSMGLKYGKAGPVQAIEQTKAIFQTIWGAIILDNIPTVLQVTGMGIGILGIFVIIL